MWGRLLSWISSLGGLIGRSRAERDLADEAAFHLRARTEHWIGRGHSEREASRRARIEFGGLESYKEGGRDAKGFRFVDDMRGDLRYGWRQLVASPALSVVAVGILAVGIGATTAVFSALDATMWRPLPVERPFDLREIVILRSSGRVETSFVYPVFAHLRDHATSFSDIVLFDRHDQINLGIRGRARLAPGLAVSGNFLRGLGARMALGRPLAPEDDRADAAVVAVLTHGGWRRLFDGDPAALGEAITINGAPATVVGVTAAGFDGVEPGRPVDVLAPLMPLGTALYPNGLPFTDGRRRQYELMGRVREGISDDQARTEAARLAQQAAAGAGLSSESVSTLGLRDGSQGLESLRVEYGPQLRLLMGISAAILLIGCANVAGLLVARAAARNREMAVRLALGASRGRLLRQMFTECFLLGSLGSAAGIGLALLLRGYLMPLLNQDSAPLDLVLGLNVRLLLLSLGLLGGVGFLCGLLPALHVMRRDLRPSSARGLPRMATDRPRLFAGKTLISLQLALSMVLLTSAFLMARSLINLRGEYLGFEPDRVALFTVNPGLSGYEDTRALDFYARVVDRIAVLPGVQSVSISRYPLLSGEALRVIMGPETGGEEMEVHRNMVAPRYFETMGIPLLAGREFTQADREKAPSVAIISQSLARVLGGATIGQRISVLGREADTEIVGIVGNARFTSVRATTPPTLYLPWSAAYRRGAGPQMTFAVRTVGHPASLMPDIRRALEDVDPLTPAFNLTTQVEQNARSWRRERVFTGVIVGAAVLTVLLACLGIWGTLSYSVARRTPEIGVRMALGAHRGDVVGLVARESFVSVLAGTLVGLTGAVVATHLIEAFLFGVGRLDPVAFGSAVATVFAGAAAATWLPARRAAAVDPVVALRQE